MKKSILDVTKNQRGQILPIVLVSLLIGSLIIVPSLKYVSTHVNAGNNIDEHVKGVYAADAGIEDAIWRSVKDADVISWANDGNSGPFYDYTLLVDPSNPHSAVKIINGMTVTVRIEKVNNIRT